MVIDYLDELKKGKTGALSYFINVYEIKLTYFCSKYIRNLEVIDEIISDTFHKLWLHKKTILSLSHLESFLFKVAKNACINTVKRGKDHLYVELDIDRHDRMGSGDIHREIVLAELMEILYREIDKLPAQQAAVFKMSFLEGLNTDEICRRLNTRENTVFNAKSMALKNLRTALKLKGIDVIFVLISLSIRELMI